jgi:hypothetical protein
MDYYVLGRFAARANMALVAGNALHHAIEFFLKGYLLKTHSYKQLTRRPFGHDLRHAWAVFKADFTHAALDSFDDTITALHSFEPIRYPDALLPNGAVLRVDWEGPDEELPPITHPPYLAKLPRFQLNMPELDRLVREILSCVSIEPALLVNSLGLDAQRYLSVDNRYFAGPLVQKEAESGPSDD